VPVDLAADACAACVGLLESDDNSRGTGSRDTHENQQEADAFVDISLLRTRCEACTSTFNTETHLTITLLNSEADEYGEEDHQCHQYRSVYAQQYQWCQDESRDSDYFDQVLCREAVVDRKIIVPF